MVACAGVLPAPPFCGHGRWLLVAGGCAAAIVHVDRREEIERAAAHYSLAEIHAFLVRLEDAARQLRENVNPQLALENVTLHLPRSVVSRQ